jgi:LPXTG-motif cell wall-anchored protein
MTRPKRRQALRQSLQVGPALAVAVIAGYFLGGCSGGDFGGVTLSGVTELPTVSRPSLTLPTPPTGSETDPGTTTEPPTTAPEPETTTVVETETTATAPTEPATTSTVPTDTVGEPPPDDNGLWGWIALALAASGGETTPTPEPPATTEATSPPETVIPDATSSETDTPWGWIAAAGALALAALVVGLVVWKRRRHNHRNS